MLMHLFGCYGAVTRGCAHRYRSGIPDITTVIMFPPLIADEEHPKDWYTRFIGCWIGGRDKEGNLRVTDVIGWNVWDDGCVDVKDSKDQSIHTGEVNTCWTF